VCLREQSGTDTKLRSYWQTQQVCWTNVQATQLLPNNFWNKILSLFYWTWQELQTGRHFIPRPRVGLDRWIDHRWIIRKHGCMCFEFHVNGGAELCMAWCHDLYFLLSREKRHLCYELNSLKTEFNSSKMNMLKWKA
jgi:hypothetical protein